MLSSSYFSFFLFDTNGAAMTPKAFIIYVFITRVGQHWGKHDLKIFIFYQPWNPFHIKWMYFAAYGWHKILECNLVKPPSIKLAT